MKRTAVFILAVSILVIALSGCGGLSDSKSSDNQDSKQNQAANESVGPDSLADQVDSYVNAGGTMIPADRNDVPDAAGDVSEEIESSSGSTSEDSPSGEEEPSDGTGDFVAKDDTVYATADVMVRNRPSIKGDPVKLLKAGEGIHRVGYSEQWTKVESKGYYYYIASKYLSETVP
ncbi:MAG: hypothetical protein K2G89_00765 [Lachnospiraceae bacterium]|nr:hypothetical protein [Lachnospiraceae bacterium]